MTTDRLRQASQADLLDAALALVTMVEAHPSPSSVLSVDGMGGVADLVRYDHFHKDAEPSPWLAYVVHTDALAEQFSNSLRALASPEPSFLALLSEPAAPTIGYEQFANDLLSEAEDEEYEPPSNTALTNAYRLWRHFGLDERSDVYPTSDREVAINVNGGYRKGLLLLFGSDGSALILLTIDGVHRRAHYDEAPHRVDGFIRDALRDLQRAAPIQR